MRAHFNRPVQDNFGNILAGTIISVFVNGTTTLVTAPIWADDTSSIALGNPFIAVDGIVNFYLDTPQRVDLGIQPPGQSLIISPDIDVETSATSSATLTFPGTGTSSTAVGANAAAGGSQAVAYGDSSSASGAQALAAGQSAQASAGQATALGQDATAEASQAVAVGAAAAVTGAQGTALGTVATATASGALAVGANAAASGVSSSALGAGAASSRTHSAAVGAGAIATEDQQVRLGTSTDYVDIPNYFTLLSDNAQIKFRVYMTDGGILYTRYHYAPDAVNLYTGNNNTFDTGIGGWTAGSHCTVGPTSTFTDIHSTGAMLITQTTSGPAYALGPMEAAQGNVYYVGKAWFFRHSGDGSATQFQAWLAFYDNTMTIIGSASLGPPQTIVNDSWIIADVRVQSPSNTAYIALQAGVPSGGSNGDKLYVDTTGMFPAATDL